MTIQQEIISALGVKPTIDPAVEFRASVEFLKDYLKKYTFIRTLILGISGGQDSTLTGKICQQAISEKRQETSLIDYQFIAVRLPYGEQKDERDCQDAITFINPDRVIAVNIKSAIKATEVTLHNSDIILSNYAKGNAKARERMKVQYIIANMTAGLVVGTGHAAEVVTGFFTKYGDAGTDINPLFRLNKRQGRILLQYLDCPNHLYSKVPTGDLDDIYPSLPDERVLGISYERIDDYLEGKTIAAAEASIIENLYLHTEHKRRPPVTVFDDYWK